MVGVGAASQILESAVFEPERLSQSLQRAGEALGFDHFCIVHSNLAKLRVIAADHSLEAFADYERGGWIAKDYRAATVNLVPDGSLYLDQVAVPEEQRLRSAVYHDLYVPHRMAFYAGWRVAMSEDTWIFSLARSEDKGPITDAEQSELHKLMPLASRALAVGHQMRGAVVGGIFRMASRTGQAVIILDHAGRVAAVSPDANDSFDRDFNVRGGRLWAADKKSQDELEKLTAIASQVPLPALIGNVVVQRSEPAWRLLLRVTPIRELGLDALPGARLLVTIEDRNRRPLVAEDELRVLYDLSAAEANILALLALGLEPAEVAERRGVSVGTVRTQIRVLFGKLGVNRIGEAVSIAMRHARYAR